MFCHDMHVPFECACHACNSTPTQMKTWDNRFWTNDSPGKQIFLDLQSEAQCTRLKNDGAMTLPGGHGCHMFYQKACEAPMDRMFCPRILAEPTSKFGVANTLENDHTKWVNERKTCRTEEGWERELSCKAKLAKTLEPSSNFCAPHHEYLACMCDACEEDVESQVDGMVRYQRCGNLEKTLLSHSPSDECDLWYSDECVAPLDKMYCEHINGTKKNRETPALAATWEDDGMGWGTYCQKVVAPLASNPAVLEESLGAGWIEWCRGKLGKNETARIAPFGSGEYGHERLVMSGMPAPRTYDMPDPALGYFNVDPHEKV